MLPRPTSRLRFELWRASDLPLAMALWEHWGAGLAREAAASVMQLAFETLEAPALFAGHHPDNAASRALLEKLGFVHTHDEPYAATGRLHPSYRRVR